MASGYRTVEFYEDPVDLAALLRGKHMLYVARPILDVAGNPVTNLVWRISPLSPHMPITWEEPLVYALNWARSGLKKGKVQVAGKWQPCKIGEVWDLGSGGFFEKSTLPPKSGYLTIGRNNYARDDGKGVYVVLGVQNKDIEVTYQPIFQDPTELGFNMSANYRPSNTLQWWFQANLEADPLSSDVDVCDVQTVVETLELDPMVKVYTSTYKFATGEWITESRGLQDARSITFLLGSELRHCDLETGAVMLSGDVDHSCADTSGIRFRSSETKGALLLSVSAVLAAATFWITAVKV